MLKTNESAFSFFTSSSSQCWHTHDDGGEVKQPGSSEQTKAENFDALSWEMMLLLYVWWRVRNEDAINQPRWRRIEGCEKLKSREIFTDCLPPFSLMPNNLIWFYPRLSDIYLYIFESRQKIREGRKNWEKTKEGIVREEKWCAIKVIEVRTNKLQASLRTTTTKASFFCSHTACLGEASEKEMKIKLFSWYNSERDTRLGCWRGWCWCWELVGAMIWEWNFSGVLSSDDDDENSSRAAQFEKCV